MDETSRQAHWQNVYTTRGEREVSWFQERPDLSLELIRAAGATPRSSVVDVGGGASRLVDALLADGFDRVTVLDVSEAALATVKRRLGSAADKVTWIVSDITTWEPAERYDLWHDRAVLHFLTDASDRAAYVARLTKALRPGGHAIIGTFALDGPERCSGLPVVRYDAAKLTDLLGPEFALVETRAHAHPTPMGSVQRFQFSLFRRR
jgi:2-polyprenyl-3-methyl-5-hydroxy-6-metoxy-1,4-benzoquinol methylase